MGEQALSMLEMSTDAYPDGIPMSLAVGNHDQKPSGETGETAAFNEHFGPERFADRGYYGGRLGSTNDNSWIRFSAGSLDVVVVTLAFDTTPDPKVLSWARQVFQSHPNALGIVNSHFVLTRDGELSIQGAAIHDAFEDLPNVRLMTSGHVTGENLRTEEQSGHVVHAMVASYQGLENGGNGWMRIWRFAPAKSELSVRTYSPALDEYQTDADSQFRIDVELAGAGGDYERVASEWGERSQYVADLEPGTYEWYAEVDDCGLGVRSDSQRIRVE